MVVGGRRRINRLRKLAERGKSRYARTFNRFLPPFSIILSNQLPLHIPILHANDPFRDFGFELSFQRPPSLYYHPSIFFSDCSSSHSSVLPHSQKTHNTHHNQFSCRQDVCPKMEQSRDPDFVSYFGPPSQLHRVCSTIPGQASMFPDWRVLCRWNVPPTEGSRESLNTGRCYKGL